METWKTIKIIINTYYKNGKNENESLFKKHKTLSKTT